ncbi:NmrA/HSCARG family protein [Christiangramia salexigens]|uniref:Nucleoside-diphosphate sugar epimerase n=1 Tax=Christiangramia salexigens TaxID=1913577 RepID=A0A1L3J7H9_9FLAO|nr:NmrA/HSCARG family protein [Christiangramia salexigens]APG61078.1 nucleoside-diphosphate sugar epimerase [Christiangramia salexigens]
MENKKIIAVVGATGAQGGGLVRAIMKDSQGPYTARAITRDVGSDKSKELEKLGAEVVKADLDDKQSLREAFKGAYGVYCVTFFWEHLSPEEEIRHAKNMADAAKEAGVKHVIWSTLEDTRKWIPLNNDSMPTLMEKYKVPHFDAKGESDHFFIESGVPYTLLFTSFYWDNFINFGMGPQKGEDGELAITFPMDNKELPGIAAEDIGKVAYSIFKAGKTYQNKMIAIAGEHLTGQKMADQFTETLGKKVKYNAIPAEVYRHFDFPGADDLGNMFQFNAEHDDYFCQIRDIGKTRSLNPELLSFKQWLEQNKQKFMV